MKNLTAIALLLGISLATFAQEALDTPEAQPYQAAPSSELRSNAYRENMQEVNLQYGYGSLPQIAVTMGGIFSAIITGGQVNISNLRSTGVIGVSYYHYIGSGRWAFGGDFSYELASFDVTPKTEGAKTSQSRSSFITIMPAVKVQWFNHPHFGMYSRLAVGVSCDINATKDSEGIVRSKPSAMFALQANPLCMEFGSPALRGYVEAGFGTQGLLMAGLKYCF